jgi:hypothetical protein
MVDCWVKVAKSAKCSEEELGELNNYPMQVVPDIKTICIDFPNKFICDLHYYYYFIIASLGGIALGITSAIVCGKVYNALRNKRNAAMEHNLSVINSSPTWTRTSDVDAGIELCNTNTS